MKFKGVIAAILGIILSWVMVFWPVRVMASTTHIGIYKQLIMDDEDDDLPPPPYTIPCPDSYTPGSGG